MKSVGVNIITLTIIAIISYIVFTVSVSKPLTMMAFSVEDIGWPTMLV